jgi:hypothetical protein
MATANQQTPSLSTAEQLTELVEKYSRQINHDSYDGLSDHMPVAAVLECAFGRFLQVTLNTLCPLYYANMSGKPDPDRRYAFDAILETAIRELHQYQNLERSLMAQPENQEQRRAFVLQFILELMRWSPLPVVLCLQECWHELIMGINEFHAANPAAKNFTVFLPDGVDFGSFDPTKKRPVMAFNATLVSDSIAKFCKVLPVPANEAAANPKVFSPFKTLRLSIDSSANDDRCCVVHNVHLPFATADNLAVVKNCFAWPAQLNIVAGDTNIQTRPIKPELVAAGAYTATLTEYCERLSKEGGPRLLFVPAPGLVTIFNVRRNSPEGQPNTDQFDHIAVPSDAVASGLIRLLEVVDAVTFAAVFSQMHKPDHEGSCNRMLRQALEQLKRFL